MDSLTFRGDETPHGLEPQPLALPAELTIYTVGELHPQWLQWLGEVRSAPGQDGALEIRAEGVDQVDAAGIQLLVSLQRALEAQGRRLHVRDPSQTLADGCGALGLRAWLDARSAAAEAA
jgi:ABC-type transporter Mla MlaB component